MIRARDAGGTRCDFVNTTVIGRVVMRPAGKRLVLSGAQLPEEDDELPEIDETAEPAGLGEGEGGSEPRCGCVNLDFSKDSSRRIVSQ